MTVAVAVVQLLPVAGSGGSAGGSDVAGSHFLLVQRPPSGLLAGLWQFPLLQLGPEEAGSLPRQQQLMDEYLEAQLGAALCPAGSTSAAGEGPTKALAVVDRRPLGQLVHVFSHIRMTMRVERIVLQVGRGACRWARALLDGARTTHAPIAVPARRSACCPIVLSV